MFLPALIHDYFVWHYTRAWRELWGVWRNLVWFVAHFFSLVQLMNSWFAPFKRITERKKAHWDFESIAGYIIINILSRLIGRVIRTVLIFAGAVSVLATIVAGIFIYVIWAVVPMITIGLIGMSISLFFISI